MNRKSLASILISALLIVTGNSYADVERVISISVTDPASLISSLDRYFDTGEGHAQSVNLLQHVVDGGDPSSHTVVVIFDNMESLEKTLDAQAESPSWAATMKSLSAVSTYNGEALAIQRKTWGKDGWSEGDYLAAVILESPEESAMIAAHTDMMDASSIKMPGMVRIVRLRVGGPGSHAALITASSYADLISYMERMEASAAFAKMRESNSSRVVGSTVYRVAKIWK